MFQHASRRRAVVAPAALATLASSFSILLVSSPAQAAGPGLVINEVYGGGGNSGATLRSDFIELRNTSASPVSLAGKSLQYRSAGGTGAVNSSNVFALPAATVPPGQTYLVKAADGTGGTQDLPTPDTTSGLALGGTGGQVFLANTTAAVDPNTPPAAAGSTFSSAVIDFVGWGTSATSFEGARGPATTNTTAVSRNAEGADTDDNGTDFTAGAPTPVACTGCTVEEPPPSDGDATIAEIQGTGATSPLAGDEVTTQGVVTALYPGTYNGFYLQTGGTGGATDATEGASDAVFVYGGSAFDGGGLTLGDSVEVTGTVSEFQGQTQVTAAADGIEVLTSPLPAVTPLAIAYPTTEAAREAHEGELLAPTDTFTVTNTYTTNQYAEIGLATGDQPLIQPTEVAAVGTPEYDAAVADNAARAVTLDDGSSLNFLSSANQSTPLPWLSQANPIRVGAAATLEAPVVLDFRNNTWKFQPQEQVTDQGADVATFENTRTENAAPQPVGGDLKLGTFNVLNYFNTTGQVFESRGGTCTYYNDRDGDPVAVNSCSPSGPRGAAEGGDLNRQQAKIVRAINTMDADIVSLEEIENSVKLLGETDRDDAVKQLVNALNAAAGTRRWAFAPSPAAADLPPVAAQDVIRTAFIYDPSTVNPVGVSKVLVGSSAFSNARQPLAQAFKPVGAGADAAFAVVVNHFKSKGDSSPPATGDNANGPQGAFNGDRRRQAAALVTFANQFAADRDIEAVFLTGDFNAYTMEDPIRDLGAAGYTPVESDQAGDYSYSFSGLSGSLDHVLANEAARELVTGADVWEINANESIAFQYSRYNYNVTRFFNAGDPFAASDHNPAVVGLTAPDGEQTEINLLNINDFHGRIDANTTRFATTVEQVRAEGGEDNSLFLSAGDNIGASLFASSIQEDEPTIDVLNALDLRTSAVGNHEFDRGFDDLTGRVADRADWSYLGANVYREGTTTPVLDQYDLFEVDGVRVAVIGAVTEETPALVSPGGIEGLAFGDPVEAVNRVAAELSDGIVTRTNEEADVIVAEYHEGAGAGTPDGSTLEEEVAAGGTFASIVEDTSADVDAIFTGHTHKQYAWDAPVPGEPGRTRPILQTGSYGENIGQIKLTYDPETESVVSYQQRNVARVAAEDLTYPRVQEVKRITDAAIAEAARIGNQPVGRISDDITTAYTGGTYGPDGYTVPNPASGRDDRAAESSLGDFVANALRDGVSDFAEPDLGITNPGGLRAELLYAGNTSGNPQNTDGVVTFAEANAVLPFNNTVAIVDLTGADLKAVLEQQWQTGTDGTVPSRPYLQLGMSDNVNVTADPTQPAGSRITSVLLDGEPLDPAATYTVSTLSFLAQGGDNFRAFTEGSYVDTGLLDAEMWRDYLAENSAEEPLAPDFARQQVFVDDLPAALPAGETTEFQLGVPTGGATAPITGTTLNLTSLGAPANTTVVATLVDGATETPLGEFPVTDGVAQVSLAVPDAGEGAVVQMVAEPSGTTVTVPVGAASDPEPVTPTVEVAHGPSRVVAGRTQPVVRAVVQRDGEPATGRVRFEVEGQRVRASNLENGRAAVRLGRFARPGVKLVEVTYLGNETTELRSVRYFIRVVR